MAVNINRHAYTDYTGKPYIYYNGVPFTKKYSGDCYQEHPYRTVVRTNLPDGAITDCVTANGMGQISRRLQSMSLFDRWARAARKDNVFLRYEMNCNYAANNLFR